MLLMSVTKTKNYAAATHDACPTSTRHIEFENITATHDKGGEVNEWIFTIFFVLESVHIAWLNLENAIVLSQNLRLLVVVLFFLRAKALYFVQITNKRVNINSSTLGVAGGKDEYLDMNIDGIREEWLSFGATFIFR
ncbi:hypothetical protein QVD17_18263 [Tagetes erecta]|uniref:Uncharacterized protein n=1 Tax=Tagetes erecta TaxID=13708 RepID=A0AAD8NW69_TARER|nr:hypothetical protein QVD17_18263 [Tagetes erecta]